MFRVTSLTSMPERQLNRLIRRIGLLLLVGIVAFVAFYAVDRYRAPAAPMVDQQLAALEDAVRKDPADVASRGQLADLYYTKRRFADAITQYSALIDAGKSIELASLGRANSYLELKQWAQAATDFNKVVEIAKAGEMAKVDTNLEAAYYGLGLVALGQNKPGDAVDPLSRAIAITRTDADALYALGTAYVQVGQPKLALEPLMNAVALVPAGWADPYTALASAYTALGKPDWSAWASAMATLETGDFTGAQAQLQKLITGDAKVEALVGLGLASEMHGDIAAANGWYQQALVADPDSTPAQMGVKRTGGAAGSASAAPSAAPSGSN